MGLLGNLFSKSHVNKSDDPTVSKQPPGLTERAPSANIDQVCNAAKPSPKISSRSLHDVDGKPVFASERADQENKTALGDRLAQKHAREMPAQDSDLEPGKIDRVGHATDTSFSHGSRRFVGFFTFLRPRKHPRASILDQQRFQFQRAVASPPESKPPGIPSAIIAQALEGTHDLMGAGFRKVSDQTAQSVDSSSTDTTVYRHPSKQASAPIVVPEIEGSVHNPFDETLDEVERLPSSDPFSDPVSLMTCYERHPSSESEPNRQLTTSTKVTGKPESLSIKRASTEQSSSQQDSGLWAHATGSSWSSRVDQNAARAAFNELAVHLRLTPLKTNADAAAADSVNHPPHPTGVIPRSSKGKLFKQRSKIFGGLRTIRSNLQLRTTSGASHGRTLRRIRTFAHLPTHSYEMNSLRGKSLEALARLGGHSFLTLPSDRFPATLRLPSCFVATATYLRVFAPSLRGLFVEAGDMKTATRIYEHFADQVFSAEKEQEKIEITLRRDQIPVDVVEPLNQKAPGDNASQVLSVAWVFKALLAGLPGGILGSKQLYQVLVKILYCTDADGPRNGDDPEELCTNFLKAKAIALALLTLASGLQLNLICAVCGLCADLLHASEPIPSRRDDLASSVGLGAARRTGSLSLERLGEVFGPLLTENVEDQTLFRAVEKQSPSRRVVEMLVGDWGNISRQLWIWGNRGSMVRAGGTLFWSS